MIVSRLLDLQCGELSPTLQRLLSAAAVGVGLGGGIFIGLLVVPTASTADLEFLWPCCDCATEDARRQLFLERFGGGPNPPATFQGGVAGFWNVAVHPLWMFVASFYTCLQCASRSRHAAVCAVAWVVGVCGSVAWSMISSVLGAPTTRAGCCACPLMDVLLSPAVASEVAFWFFVSLATLAPLMSLTAHLMSDKQHDQSATRRKLPTDDLANDHDDEEAPPDVIDIASLFSKLDADKSGDIVSSPVRDRTSCRLGPSHAPPTLRLPRAPPSNPNVTVSPPSPRHRLAHRALTRSWQCFLRSIRQRP